MDSFFLVDISTALILVSSLLALGGVAGFLAGLLGIGGGTILVPGLFYVFHYLGFDGAYIVHQAVGTSLATIIFTGISSSRSHWKRGAVDFDLVTGLGLGIGFGALSGAFIADQLSGFVITLLFAIIIGTLAMTMMGKVETFRLRDRVPGQPWRGFAGYVIGVGSSIIGIGGATFCVPYMCLFGVPVHRAVGTAAALGLFIAVPGTLGFMYTGWGEAGLVPYSIGFVNVPAWLIVITMSVLIAPFGARASHAIPVDVMRKIFAVFKVCVAAHLVWEML